jgi:hypothetical protein
MLGRVQIQSTFLSFQYIFDYKFMLIYTDIYIYIYIYIFKFLSKQTNFIQIC